MAISAFLLECLDHLYVIKTEFKSTMCYCFFCIPSVLCSFVCLLWNQLCNFIFLFSLHYFLTSYTFLFWHIFRCFSRVYKCVLNLSIFKSYMTSHSKFRKCWTVNLFYPTFFFCGTVIIYFFSTYIITPTLLLFLL